MAYNSDYYELHNIPNQASSLDLHNITPISIYSSEPTNFSHRHIIDKTIKDIYHGENDPPITKALPPANQYSHNQGHPDVDYILRVVNGADHTYCSNHWYQLNDNNHHNNNNNNNISHVIQKGIHQHKMGDDDIEHHAQDSPFTVDGAILYIKKLATVRDDMATDDHG